MARLSRFQVGFAALALLLAAPNFASAYLSNGRWGVTATDGPTDPVGNPITLTWSIVPDGTMISHLSKPSNLISVFDGLFPGSVGVPLVEKPWFALVQQSFNRWGEISGITYRYEPADDGLGTGTAFGQLGVRGDVRLGGATIDGSNGTLAEAGFIPNADITIDTSDTAHFGNIGGGNYINLRATLMHEIGHSLGLDHVDSNNAALLMEQAFQSTFDGPQFDEIRGVQYLYGDRLEKGDLGNNNTITRATDLGEILDGSTRLVGADGTTGVRVEPAENDFVSISNSSDADYFSFTVDQSSLADIVLTPVGPTYNERIPPLSPRPTVTVSQNDLFLELYSLNSGIPTLLSSADLTVAGEAESILDFELPAAGTYYVRSGGKSNAVQLYTLSIGVESLVTEPVSLGDFNDDGIVDASDYSVWRDNLGAADEAGILGRGDGLNGVDEGDFAVWQSHFGTVYPPGVLGSGAVPEPILAANLAAGALIAGCLWTRRPR